MSTLHYRAFKRCYKYKLTRTFALDTPVTGYPVQTPYITLRAKGRLIVEESYAWDGASGPTRDTPSTMRGSLVHDALYQLMRGGHLPQSMRKAADQLLIALCREDGMGRIRAWIWYRAIRWRGGSSARPDA